MFVLYIWVALGVVVSVVLPILRPLLPKPLRMANAPADTWIYVKPYVITAIFSLLVALVIVFYLGDAIATPQAAFLAGYTADSTLQKLTTGNK